MKDGTDLPSIPAPVKSIVFFIGSWIVLPFIRMWLDTFWLWYHDIWMANPQNKSQDGCPVSSGCLFEFDVPYGSHSDENMDIVRPEEGGEDKLAVVFLHGGGWVACKGRLILQNKTPFVRKGHTLYSLNYPLSPENRFPTALVSVLRGLNELRTVRGVENIVIMGDSAGGSLSTMATAVVCNPHLLEALSRDPASSVGHEMLSWRFPKISGCISIYGLLHPSAFYRSVPQLSRIEHAAWCMAYWFSFTAYKPVHPEAAFHGKCTILELMDMVDRFPPLMQTVGDRDPLIHSAVLLHECFKARNMPSTLCVHPHRHTYFSMPVGWTFGTWKTGSLPATESIFEFLALCANPKAAVTGPMEQRCSTSRPSALPCPAMSSHVHGGAL
eukprot:NODE_1962_length_1343_cov_33.199382_g1779_i0.p1 GENE.NODE_1962_length_1343_cov_33.199382_g1779_i0~~NODE_1962_length_1343_cov_33.199382_g1779_i0.p1  ORF type:complete len:384 (-),score=26.13 NODE_1962_length_1343_cov_33.199382_g1779_i0:111-1262(-)